MINISLYPHQIEALNKLEAALHTGHRCPVIQAPTGFGKTVLAAKLCDSFASTGRRVIFCVPRISLVEQTLHRFYEYGLRNMGVIQGSHPMTNPSLPVQIASIQTLCRRRHLPEADAVIVDECHMAFKFVYRWMSDWDSIPFIGLSATPWTKGMGKHYDNLIKSADLTELIESGYLCDYEVYGPDSPDLKGVKIQNGDYVEREIADKMAPLTANVVTTWKNKGENRSTFVYAVTRDHAKGLQLEFEQAGIPTGYVDCKTTLEDRDVLRKKFESGEIKVVCNVGVLTTGIDWDVRCLVIARPTRSKMLHVQIVGRGLRTAAGKKDLLILDHSDNHTRLGFVTDIRIDQLNKGEKQQQTNSEPLPKPCPQCAYLRPPRKPECPQCGYKPPKRVVSITENKKGSLKKLRKTTVVSQETLDNLYSQIKWIQKERQYSTGWAAHTFKKMTGEWPTRAAKNLPISQPAPEVYSFVHKELRKYWREIKRKAR